MPTGLRFFQFWLLLTLAPSFCNDVVIDKGSGLAFLACDPFKPYFYPPYELNNVSQVYGDGGIWVYDTNVWLCVTPLTVGPVNASSAFTFSRRRVSSRRLSSYFPDHFALTKSSNDGK
jgi:hypothetical protein